ncbi:MAG: DNA repair protein RadC [Nitrospirae bacterium]|nr:DNA repair protein RadC [Nitrospirota bacterium]
MPTDPERAEPDHAEHRKRLRARFAESGLSGFADHEALEFLLTFAIPRRDTKPVAKALLKRFKTLGGVMNADMRDLSAVDGIGEHSATLISLARAISERMFRQDAQNRFSLTSPQALYDYCRVSFGGLGREQFRAFFLNTRNELVAEEILQEGTIDQAAVYPRTVIEQAIRHKASGVLFAHNHPSGSLTPSPQDIDLTKRLSEAAATVGVRVHDHLIVSDHGYMSLREQGYM